MLRFRISGTGQDKRIDERCYRKEKDLRVEKNWPKKRVSQGRQGPNKRKRDSSGGKKTRRGGARELKL